MTNGDWRKSLKPGDMVIVITRMDPFIAKISRTTKTQVVIPFGAVEIKFRRSDGREVGNGLWNSKFIQEATPEEVSRIREQVRRRSLISELKGTDWSKLSINSLEKINKLVADEQSKERTNNEKA